LTLQKTRDEFIAGSQQVINDSLSSLQQKQDSLSKEIKELEVKRKELLIPLDDEWREVERIKKQFEQRQEENLIEKEQLNERENQIKKTENEISQLAEQTRFNASETEKSKANAFSLEEMAQRKYEMAETERVEQNEAYEKKSKELQAKISTYENGISVNETKEKDLETREVALLSERKHLESQQRTFLLAKGIK
jgi:chromosome segregation ATPase